MKRWVVFLFVACGARTPPGGSVRGDAATGSDAAPVDADLVVHACKPGDAPVILGTGEADAIAIDATHVYWSGPEGVRRVPKTGGTVQMLGGGRSVISVAVDGAHVYYANRESGSIVRQPKGGGAVESMLQGQMELWSIALDDTFLYWGFATPNVDHVHRMSKPTKDREGIDDFDGNPVSIAIADHDVVIGTGRTGNVRARSRSDNVVRTVLNSESFVWDVACSGDFAYVTSQGPRGGKGGRIVRVSLATQRGPQFLATNLAYPYGIATDGASVYWTDRIEKTVKKVSVNGGPTSVVYTAGGPTWDVVVDGDCVYITNDQPGAVIRVPK